MQIVQSKLSRLEFPCRYRELLEFSCRKIQTKAAAQPHLPRRLRVTESLDVRRIMRFLSNPEPSLCRSTSVQCISRLGTDVVLPRV